MNDVRFAAIARFIFTLSLGAVGGLVFGMLVGFWEPIKVNAVGNCAEDSLYCLIHSWQTLIAGGLAVFGAIWTVVHMRKQTMLTAYFYGEGKALDYSISLSHKVLFDEMLDDIEDKFPDLADNDGGPGFINRVDAPTLILRRDLAPRMEFNPIYLNRFLRLVDVCKTYQTLFETEENPGACPETSVRIAVKLIKADLEDLREIAYGNEQLGRQMIKNWNANFPPALHLTMRRLDMPRDRESRDVLPS